MNDIVGNNIGMTWKSLVSAVKERGTELFNEGLEITDVRIIFSTDKGNDIILEKHADKEMIQNMMKVFFSNEKNSLGHSYSDFMRGPLGRNDLTDIIELLQEKRICKRATLTLTGNGNGKVPCINIINFLIRNEKLDVYYFSRGQDAYKKFYADALCIAKMQLHIAKSLNMDIGLITGYIASAHIYNEDIDAIDLFLADNHHI